MANASIFAAFERMWHHIVLALNNKANQLQQNIDELASTTITNPDVGSIGQALIVKQTDENGKPIAWEYANAGGEGAAQVQSDWKETNQTLPSYIKNKPSKNDALDLVSEMGFVVPVADAQDNLFVDADGNVYSLV